MSFITSCISCITRKKRVCAYKLGTIRNVFNSLSAYYLTDNITSLWLAKSKTIYRKFLSYFFDSKITARKLKQWYSNIGHFRVPLCLCFKVSLWAKMTLICMKMKLHVELIFIWKVMHLSLGQTDRQVVASGRKLNLYRDLRWVAKRLASFFASTRKSQKRHFKAEYPLFYWLIIG